MQTFALYYTLQNYYYLTELPPNKTFLSLSKKYKDGHADIITNNLKAQFLKKKTFEIFKSLLLFHVISKSDVSIFYNFQTVFYQDPITLKDAYNPDISNLSYWGELYSNELQQTLLYHKKYTFLDGNYRITMGECLPLKYRNVAEMEQLEVETFSLYAYFEAFVSHFFKTDTTNPYLQKAVFLSFNDLAQIFELLVKVENYVSLIKMSKLNVEKLNECRQRIKTHKQLFTKKKYQTKHFLKIAHVVDYKKDKTQLQNFLVEFPIPELFTENVQRNVVTLVSTKHSKEVVNEEDNNTLHYSLLIID